MIEPDPDLLRRSASGEGAAFKEFVERHQASVFRFIQTLTSERADAEDALQETFLAAWRSAATFRGDASARAWVLTIARNAVRRQHRRRVGEPAEFLSLDELGLHAGWGSQATPEELFARPEDRAMLERALASLSKEDRQILILRDLEGFSGEETAELLDLSLAAEKSRLHRARLRLTAALKEAYHADA